MKKLTLIICLTLVSGFTFSQWTQLNPLLPGNTLNSVYFTDANTGYAVGSEGIILKTDNGGAKWTALSSGTNSPLNSVFFTDANTGYVVGGYYNPMCKPGDGHCCQIILKTIDGGATWTGFIREYYSPLYSVFFTDANTGFAVGGKTGGSVILKTIDRGTTWTELSIGTNYPLKSVYFSDSNTGYAVGWAHGTGGDNIIKTIDGGITWTELSSGTESHLNSVYFTDSITGFAVGWGTTGGGPIILKTIDGGANWTTFYNVTNSPLSSVYFVDANIGYAVGEYGSIIKTIDGGTNWINLPSETTYIFNSVFFTDANTGYAVGEGGTILKTTNGGGFPTLVENVLQESTFTVYPNPATNKISIETHGNLLGETTICIFNINGALLQQEKFQSQNLIEMDVSAMAKGIYLLQIQTKAGVESKKLVVQ